MSRTEDLLSGIASTDGVPDLGTYPFHEPDALREAHLLDVRIEAVSARVGLLFDLRHAIDFGPGNTGVLIAAGVTECSWVAEPQSTGRTAWTVMGFDVHVGGAFVDADVFCFPKARLTITASRFDYLAVDVEDLTKVADHGLDSEEAIRANLAQWSSPVRLLGKSSTAG
ncbi:hypothetical protein [Herbidospora mongoliensis]|uniref:hypothetical protein n=1 Tax=Herbidospora mongoliensis TaxID=688067 RepID=UPI0012F93482|nr:hypothetical protein [Herbidospora mongoliensis]